MRLYAALMRLRLIHNALLTLGAAAHGMLLRKPVFPYGDLTRARLRVGHGLLHPRCRDRAGVQHSPRSRQGDLTMAALIIHAFRRVAPSHKSAVKRRSDFNL